MPLFDAAMREFAYQRYQGRRSATSGPSPTSIRPSDPAEARLVPIVAGPGGRRSTASSSTVPRPSSPGSSSNSFSSRAPGRGSAGRRSHEEPEAGPCAAGWPWPRRSHQAAPAGQHHHGASAGPQLVARAAARPRRRAQARLADAVRPAASALEDRPRRAGRLRRRARPGRADAGLDQRLDDADPEPGGHAGHGREHDRSASGCWAASWTTWCSASEEIAAVVKRIPGRRRRRRRPDPRQGLPRDPLRPRAGRRGWA